LTVQINKADKGEEGKQKLKGGEVSCPRSRSRSVPKLGAEPMLPAPALMPYLPREDWAQIIYETKNFYHIPSGTMKFFSLCK